MPTKLPVDIKLLVIQQWLTGDQRDKIAADAGISAGAVTNIVNEWRHALGFSEANELREMAVTLRKIGITYRQCAIGSRVAMIMTRLGVEENNFESFMSDVYHRCCNDLGLTPQLISSYISNLLEFSQSVSFSQIPNYISQKIEEKKKVEQEIEKLKDQLEMLQKQKSEAESSTKLAVDNHKITEDKLKWYSEIKEELEKTYELPVDDIPKFASMVNRVKQHFGYDAQKVIKEFSHLHLVLTEHAELQARIAELKYQHSNIKKQYSAAQQMLQTADGSLSVYDQLSAMGIGLEELRSLYNTVIKIADANKTSSRDEAISKFFKDISEQYDRKLGFESKIDKLNVEVNKLTQEETRLHGEINAIPRLGPPLVKLLNIYNSNNTSIEEIELLIDKLHKSGGIKAAINKLDQSTQDKEEIRGGTSEAEAVLADQANRSNSNGKTEEEQQSLIVAAAGQDNDVDPDDVQFRSMIDKAIAQFSTATTPSILRHSSSAKFEEPK